MLTGKGICRRFPDGKQALCHQQFMFRPYSIVTALSHLCVVKCLQSKMGNASTICRGMVVMWARL